MLTGGSGVGKTTLIDMLSKLGHHTVPEAGQRGAEIRKVVPSPLGSASSAAGDSLPAPTASSSDAASISTAEAQRALSREKSLKLPYSADFA